MKNLYLSFLLLAFNICLSQQSLLFVSNGTSPNNTPPKLFNLRLLAYQYGAVGCLPRIYASMTTSAPPSYGLQFTSYNNGYTTGIGSIPGWSIRTSDSPPTAFYSLNGNVPQFYVDNTDWAGVTILPVDSSGNGNGEPLLVGRKACNVPVVYYAEDIPNGNYAEYVEVAGVKVVYIMDL